MPELPEVETVRRGLQPVLEGARLVKVEARRPDLRFPFPERFSQRLTGKTVTALGRRAKYLTIHVENGPTLICHLGMSGSFRVEADGSSGTPGSFHHERSKSAAHDHVVFDVVSPRGERSRVIFNDPRRFGFMLFAEGAPDTHPMLAGLGVEPTGNALDGALLASLLDGRRSPLKAALLDQRLIAGLGNIYVAAALWRANSKCSELVSSALDGMHPMLTQVPPSVLSFSTQTVLKPTSVPVYRAGGRVPQLSSG